jgi:hypothetical protein
LGNNSCSTNPSSSNVHCYHRISHSMALGMDWDGPVHRFGVVLSGLELGTIPLERLFGNFRSLDLGRCSFSVQLDIQITAENAVVAAQLSLGVSYSYRLLAGEKLVAISVRIPHLHERNSPRVVRVQFRKRCCIVE